MAAGAVNSNLFVDYSGAPMQFFMSPGILKEKMKPLIEDRGGILLSKILPYKSGASQIKLGDPSKEYSSAGYISTSYILDSVKDNLLKDMNNYRLPKQTSQRKSANTAVVSSTTSTRRKRSRYFYTAAEDQAILEYVRKHACESYSVGGNNLWKMMETEKVTIHPWSSMQTRYRRYILKSLGKKPRSNTTQLTIKRHLKGSGQEEEKLGRPKRACVSRSVNRSQAKDNDSKEKGDPSDNDGMESAGSDTDYQPSGSPDDNDTEEGQLTNTDAGDDDNGDDDVGDSGDTTNDEGHEDSAHDEGDSNGGGSEGDSNHGDNGNSENDQSEILHQQSTDDNTRDKDVGCSVVVEDIFNKFEKIKVLQHRYQVPRAVIIHALFVANGEIKVAEEYLSGLLKNGDKAWSPEENETILSQDKEELEQLVKTRGRAAVMNRRCWLKGL